VPVYEVGTCTPSCGYIKKVSVWVVAKTSYTLGLENEVTRGLYGRKWRYFSDKLNFYNILKFIQNQNFAQCEFEYLYFNFGAYEDKGDISRHGTVT